MPSHLLRPSYALDLTTLPSRFWGLSLGFLDVFGTGEGFNSSKHIKKARTQAQNLEMGMFGVLIANPFQLRFFHIAVKQSIRFQLAWCASRCLSAIADLVLITPRTVLLIHFDRQWFMTPCTRYSLPHVGRDMAEPLVQYKTAPARVLPRQQSSRIGTDNEWRHYCWSRRSFPASR